MTRNPIIALSVFAVAACGDPVTDRSIADEEPLAQVAAEEDGGLAESRTLEAGDLAGLDLGGRIEGPQGNEVKTSLSNELGVLAELVSFVACPGGMAICNPSAAPQGTVYTYVHVVKPGENMNTRGGDGNSPGEDAKRPMVFMMAAPAHGFTGEAGYSQAEASAAGGSQVEVQVSCEEDGQIFWTVNLGDDNGWTSGEPITFYWRSTLPPASPAPVYSLRVNGVTAVGPGPYPAEDPAASNACMASSTRG